MEPNDRLIEIVFDILEEIREIKSEVKTLRTDTNNRFEKLEKAVDYLGEQQAKTNLALSESRFSNMTLAGKIEELLEIDKRVRILENIVLNKAS